MADTERKLPEPVTERRSILYEIVRGLAAAVFRTVMPVRCFHRERLDAEAPYVLIANHRHALDPIALALFVRKRQIVFLAKKELAKNRAIAWLLSCAHVSLVGRHETDMAAMRNCMKAMKMKKILLVFPEGTRHHEGQMEQIESGASLIALRSRAPIIPVYIDRKLGFFRRTGLHVGEPIPYGDLLEKGINAETCQEMNERFRETFRKMIAQSGGEAEQ